VGPARHTLPPFFSSSLPPQSPPTPAAQWRAARAPPPSAPPPAQGSRQALELGPWSGGARSSSLGSSAGASALGRSGAVAARNPTAAESGAAGEEQGQRTPPSRRRRPSEAHGAGRGFLHMRALLFPTSSAALHHSTFLVRGGGNEHGRPACRILAELLGATDPGEFPAARPSSAPSSARTFPRPLPPRRLPSPRSARVEAPALRR
jgi:hypothetical protein